MKKHVHSQCTLMYSEFVLNEYVGFVSSELDRSFSFNKVKQQTTAAKSSNLKMQALLNFNPER
jgi:hypothetical protein